MAQPASNLPPQPEPKDGGPAFGKFVRYGDAAVSDGGISVRDYFAAQTLSASIAIAGDWLHAGTEDKIRELQQTIAQRCYEFADAMLAERERAR